MRMGQGAGSRDRVVQTSVAGPSSEPCMLFNGFAGHGDSRHGWSRNSSSAPRRPSCNHRSAVSLRIGRPLRKETWYLGNANGSSGTREWWRRAETRRPRERGTRAAESMEGKRQDETRERGRVGPRRREKRRVCGCREWRRCARVRWPWRDAGVHVSHRDGQWMRVSTSGQTRGSVRVV